MNPIQSARDVVLNSKKAETRSILATRNRLLKGLYHFTKLAGTWPKSLEGFHSANGPLSQLQSQFLDENDIEKGRYFRDELLPFPASPSPPIVAAANSSAQLSASSSVHAPSPLSPGSDYPSRVNEEQSVKASPSPRKDVLSSRASTSTHTPPRSPVLSTKSDDEDTPKASAAQSLNLAKNESSSGQSSDGEDFNIEAGDEPVAQKGNDLSLAKQEREDAAASGLVDASSPSSSTAGAQSTFTPKAAHHSPDTSPDPESIVEPATSISGSQNTDDNDNEEEKEAIGLGPDAQLRQEAEANTSADKDKTTLRKRPAALEMPPPSTPNRLFAKLEPGLDGGNHSGPGSATQPSADVEMKDASPAKAIGAAPTPISATDLTPGRMTTRVASGAIRQKSVSEILGETPKQSPHGLPSPLSRRNTATQTPQTPDIFDRSRMSTVIFSKDRDAASTKALHSELDGYLALKGASLDPEKDYLRPLFLYQAWAPPRAATLHELLLQTKKTVNSADMNASFREQADFRILRRIYHLQNTGKWSLRQPAKFQDPIPGPCHMDHVLVEMKWMRIDFREERRWKQALVRNMAEWCAEFVNATPDRREQLRIKPKHVVMDLVESPPTLVSSTGTSEVSEEDLSVAIVTSNPPVALFSLGYDDLVFNIDSTPAGDALLAELPLYDPKASRPETNSVLPPSPSGDNISAVSRMVTGKLIPKLIGFPKKRNRYDFTESDDDSGPRHKRTKSSDPSSFLSPARRSSPRSELPPEKQDVSLFNPINKHILDRLRANHAFRPPSEFPMPSQDFFQMRPQSQWTWDEDQRLRHCVRKYHYNWSLISMDLQAQCQPSKQISGPERRTPWECFERWFQLEGLPNEMSKTPYFKTYQGRLEQANKLLQIQAATAAQQAQAVGTPTGVKRRTSCQPLRVDRRRETRHVTMIDAMRKLVRKRENNLARQAEAQKAAAMRKSHEQPNHAVRQPILTPQEFSKRRYDAEMEQKRRQELARKQKQMADQQHKLAQQRQLSGSGPTPQNPQQQALAAAAQQQIRLQTPTQTPATPQVTAAQPQATPKFSAAGGLQNPNVAAALGIGSMSVSPAQAQQFAALKATGKVPPHMELAQFLHLQQQQRQMLAAQAAQSQAQAQNPGLVAAHLSPSSNTNNMQPSQQQMLAALQQQRAAMGNLAAGNAMAGMMGQTSNHQHNIGNGMGQMQLNSNAAAAIMNVTQQIMNHYPQLTADQARQAAEQRVKSHLRQSAVAAASGNVGMQGLASFANGANNLSPQQQQVLAQQHLGLNLAQQQTAGAGNAQAQLMAAFAAQNGFAHPNQTAMHMNMANMSNGTGGSPTQMFRSPAVGNLGLGSLNLGNLSNINLSGLTASQQAQILQSHQQHLQVQAQAQAQARLSSGSPGLMPARPDSRAGTQTPAGQSATSAMMGRSGSLGGVSVGASPALAAARLAAVNAAGTPGPSKAGSSAAGSPVVGTPGGMGK